MNIPRYLSSSTHGNAMPAAVHGEAHTASLLEPTRKQQAFLVLITISSKSSSFSQNQSSFSSSWTEGAFFCNFTMYMCIQTI